uniref:GH18 domain-containing protein n=1 Tax=Tetradesmus obliquus TaxID=3088 RepID=A0A383VZ49_TETOB|eukprot:jgi/Sobl393_1/7159/SZX69686.1
MKLSKQIVTSVVLLLLLGSAAAGQGPGSRLQPSDKRNSSSSSSSNSTTKRRGSSSLGRSYQAAVSQGTEIRQGTEISPTVMIYGFPDMESDTGPRPCQKAISNSKGLNAKRINFMITVYGVHKGRYFDRFYYKDRKSVMLPVEASQTARYRQGLEKCFKAALDAGFTGIHILAHVDVFDQSLSSRTLWRNVVLFSPTAPAADSSSGSYSYTDALLQPAAEALNNVINRETTVEFTLAGEQGLSVWSYPRDYTQAMQRMRSILSRGGLDPSRHTFGVSFNYDKVCGCVEPEERDPIRYNNTYMERYKRAAPWIKKNIDVEGVKQLLDASDFIGLSSYAPLPANLTQASMEVSIETAAFEMQPFGIDLKSYLFAKGKPLVYSEQGIGGCTDNKRLPPSLDYIRVHPFSGCGGSYSSQLDPWKVPEYQAYRRKLYQLLADWAAVGGGPQYRVDGIYVWNSGSWDVMGVNPSSTTREGTYADSVIKGYVQQLNAAVNGYTPTYQQLGPSQNNKGAFGSRR